MRKAGAGMPAVSLPVTEAGRPARLTLTTILPA
jgi:hypothetical protein